jgi:hypothetical protein
VRNRGSFALLCVVSLVLAALAGLGFAAVQHGLGEAAAARSLGTPAAAAPASPTSPAAETTAPATSPSGDITLRADRAAARSGERIFLSGVVAGRGRAGVALVAQEQRSGRWSDFPAHGRSRADGRFTTYVVFGRTGVHVLRVRAVTGDRVSNQVTVTVG